jgi:competence protein ComEC
VHFNIPVFKEAPFVRLLIALVAGILMQWYLPLNNKLIYILFGLVILVLFSASLLGSNKVIAKRFILSLGFHGILFLLGTWLVESREIDNNKNHYSNIIQQDSAAAIILALDEPIVNKTKTYKANANVIAMVSGSKKLQASAKVILYFKKDSTSEALQYGSTIGIKKILLPITNSGNPGAFDYKQFSLHKGITHQVFLNESEYVVLPEKHTTAAGRFLYSMRDKILQIVKQNIKAEKERGLAEALLIGYRDDMDKDLSQAYGNTGTVHVIAISGLHLGFIYLLIVGCFDFIQKYTSKKSILKFIEILRPVFVIAILWIFSLMAGAAPSILRSAIMFTCIALGSSINRSTNIFNTLSVSAFIILCINPFALWDVGFQLSYAAVVSIVMFMKPIYNWFYFKYVVFDWVWKLTAVTLSAQLLTIPITIYHFHQFPNLFLLTNLVAVPLSTAILAVLLLLIVTSWWAVAAKFVGNIGYWLIRSMNNYIEWWNGFGYALSDYLTMNLLQCYLLYGIILSACYWLLRKNIRFLQLCLILLVVIFISNIYYNEQALNKRKILVYNISGYTAIDLVEGKSFEFIGDSAVINNPYLQNFHVKPARIYYQTDKRKTTLSYHKGNSYYYAKKHLLVIDNETTIESTNIEKPNIDILIVTKNATHQIESLTEQFNIKRVVLDASNKQRTVKKWKTICQERNIPIYNTAESGAYILDV